MKNTVFTLHTSKGLKPISCNYFWETYVHCVDVHPEEDPIKSALEHCLGHRLVNTEIPPMVLQGLGEIVMFFTPRAKPGNIVKAVHAYRAKYPDAKLREKLNAEALMNYKHRQLLNNMPKGTMQ